jgi:phosphatidylserine/phosphatidylglycerophosphate/cardiolipin synthase-like enzyme
MLARLFFRPPSLKGRTTSRAVCTWSSSALGGLCLPRSGRASTVIGKADQPIPSPESFTARSAAHSKDRFSMQETQRHPNRAGSMPNGYARRKCVRQITTGRMPLEWTEVTLVSDDPAKGLGLADRQHLLFPRLMALLATPSRSVDLVSAYFVPGRKFSGALERLARSGVRVRIPAVAPRSASAVHRGIGVGLRLKKSTWRRSTSRR